MNKTASRESVQEIQDAVAEWLRLAVNHAKAAQYLRRHKALRPQMLFLVQQSMEDAVKGIARNAGLSHPDVRHSGHEILRLFVWLHGQVVSTTDTAAYIDNLLARHSADDQKYSIVTQIQDLLMLTTSDRNGQHLGENQRKAARQFFESALTASPTEVNALIDLAQHLGKLRNSARTTVRHVTHRPMMFDLSSPTADSLFDQIIEQTQERLVGRNDKQAASARALVKHLIRMSTIHNGEDELRSQLKATGGKVAFDKSAANQILMASFDIPIALTQMLIVAALVWPHESYPRYVAPPEASLDFREAAKTRTLGSKHYYSDDLGVIKYTPQLSNLASKITSVLSRAYNEGYLRPIPEIVQGMGSTMEKR